MAEGVRTDDLSARAWTLRALRVRASPDGVLPGAELVAALREGVPGRLPGSVHEDLLTAGLIGDPYQDDEAWRTAWIGESDWCYETELTPEDGTARETEAIAHQLVLSGVQGVATVVLGGTAVARIVNSHREYRIDVGDHLRAGGARLRIEFASAARAMREAEAADPGGPLPHDWGHPYERLRIVACTAGWDWAPPMLTAGVAGRAVLESWAGPRLEARVRTTLESGLGSGELLVDVSIGGSGGEAATGTVEVRMAEHCWVREVDGATHLRLPVPAPQPWWPRGYGAPRLYEVEVALLGTGQRVRRRVGFRHVRLDTSPDEHGRRFVLVVNGREVFARGANWIPDDLRLVRTVADHYATRVGQAAGANMTMLRVWGGGRYEHDAFYEACDEAGLLVWQDFAFACAAYPEEEPLCSEVEAEAREQVRRLAAHPSVVIWNGSNECLQGWEDWGWPERVGDRTWGHGYYWGLLPAVLAEEAPEVPYVPSSPFSSTPGVAANADGEGTVHLWDQWNLLDHATYRDHVPRFVAELGHQAPATWATLARSMSDWPVAPDSEAMAFRQRQPGGMAHLLRRLEGHVPEPHALAGDLDDWLWATQLHQADALRAAAGHLRGSWPRTAGMLVWQLNDAWPGISWSVLDHGGRPKPAWYALRRAFAPRAISIEPRDGSLWVVLVNDTDDPWEAETLVRRVHVEEGEWAADVLASSVPPRSVARLLVPAGLAQPHRRREEILVADVSGLRATSALCRPDGVRWAPARPRVAVTEEVTAESSGWYVAVSADVVLSDVALLVDRVDGDARVDDMLRTLLPGETVSFAVTVPSPGAAGSARLVRPPVLRTRNDLWHR